jgi:hypothetical protein
VQDRSKTNVFIIDCEEEEKLKKRSFVLFWNKAKKNEDNRSSTIEDLRLLAARRNKHSTELLRRTLDK